MNFQCVLVTAIVYITAFTLCDAASYGDIRLVGGNNNKEGRVEIYTSSWGTICDDHWDYLDARVVCRQLGLGSYGTTLTGSNVPDGSGNIWLDDVHCRGTESTLLSCPRNSIGSHNCGHHEDAGVRCYGTPPRYAIRLTGGNGHDEGRVEVFHNHVWKTVCDDRFNWEEADVICKSLGFRYGARSYHGSAHYGQGYGLILLDEIHCSGREWSLFDCPHSGFHRHDCTHSEDAGVACAASQYIMNLAVILGRNTLPPYGYTKIYTDLNWGAGGEYIYLCYRKGVRGSPITGINVIAASGSSFPAQYSYYKINVDLNKGSGGDYIYVFYTRTTSRAPISSVSVVVGEFAYPLSSWVRIETDCNKKVGGKYIYICYRQPRK